MYPIKKKEIGIPAALSFGLLMSLIITAIGAAVMAWLIAEGTVGEGSGTITAYGIQLLSAVAGALLVMILIRRMRLQLCLLSGVIYYLTLLGVNALFFEGEYADLLLTGIIILSGCTIAALLPAERKHKGRRNKRRF